MPPRTRGLCVSRSLHQSLMWRLDGGRAAAGFLVLRGGAGAGAFEVSAGDAAFVEAGGIDARVGPAWVTGLAAYPESSLGEPAFNAAARDDNPKTSRLRSTARSSDGRAEPRE